MSVVSSSSSSSSSLLGLMEYRFRKEKSAKGHSKDELLSALQKYIRRGEFQKAIYVGIELERFSELPEAKALVTNFVNRLRVAMVEETAGLTCPLLPKLFNTQFSIFEEFRFTDASKRKTAILNMIKMLVQVQKQRLLSDVKAVYFTPDAKKFILTHGRDVWKALYANVPALDNSVVSARFPLKQGDDTTTFRPIVDGLLTAMKNKSDDGFYWLNLLVEATEKQIPAGKRQITPTSRANSNPMYILFELCFAYARQGERLWNKSAVQQDSLWSNNACQTLQICFNYYQHFGLTKQGIAKSHRDWIVFVIWPLFYCIRNVDWTHNDPTSWFSALSTAEVEELYKKHTNSAAIELDDYVFDQHTSKGRSLKRKADFFAFQGALTTNEDVSLFNELYRSVYNEFKQYQANGLQIETVEVKSKKS